MNLPRNVEEQGKLADALLQEEVTRRAALKDGAPPAGTPGKPAPAGGSPGQPAQPAKPAPDAPPGAAAPKEETVEYWKSRFDVLEGKYNAEVPRLAAERRALIEENTRLKESKSAAPSGSAPTAPAARPSEEKVKELKEKYGDQFVDDFLQSFTLPAGQPPAADDKTAKDIADLKARDTARSKREFFDGLDIKAPVWRKLNEDEKFLTWLAELDPASGRSRQDLFDDAVASFDLARVAYFFNTYGSQTGAGQPKPGGDAPKNEDATPPQPPIDPPKGGGDKPPAGKKMWTGKEVQQFYDDVRRGRYKSDEVASIEQDILSAQREGRFAG
jgi:hypothetical protein